MNAQQYLMIGGASLLLAGCASAPPPSSVTVARPAPVNQVEDPSAGYLQVYSATQTDMIYDYNRHYPRVDYSIYDESGKLLRTVTSPATNQDGGLTELQFPPGHYKIVVHSKTHGDVTKPVIIKKGITSLVNLGGE